MFFIKRISRSADKAAAEPYVQASRKTAPASGEVMTIQSNELPEE